MKPETADTNRLTTTAIREILNAISEYYRNPTDEAIEAPELIQRIERSILTLKKIYPEETQPTPSDSLFEINGRLDSVHSRSSNTCQKDIEEIFELILEHHNEQGTRIISAKEETANLSDKVSELEDQISGLNAYIKNLEENAEDLKKNIIDKSNKLNAAADQISVPKTEIIEQMQRYCQK